MKETGGYALATASGEGYQSGMTLRDYFAGQALVNIMAFWGDRAILQNCSDLAGKSYQVADAMLAEREKE